MAAAAPLPVGRKEEEAHEENLKQIEAGKKKAQKEAEKEANQDRTPCKIEKRVCGQITKITIALQMICAKRVIIYSSTNADAPGKCKFSQKHPMVTQMHEFLVVVLCLHDQ
ncbi:hypothetical protein EJB05_00865, partial [Eragrostis curvula]